MPDWWNDTLTLYRKQKTKDTNGHTIVSWQREVLHDCFFGVTERQIFDGSAIIRQPSFIVRVPATYVIFARGDIIMKGEVEAETPDKTADNAFVINVIRDNSKMDGDTAHYYGGEV